MSGSIQHGPSNLSQGVNLVATEKMEAAETTQMQSAQQLSAKEGFVDAVKDMSNPFGSAMTEKLKKVESPAERVKKAVLAEDKPAQLLPVERIKDSADQFQRRNPELQASVLTLLRQYIKPGDSLDEILKKLLEFYADPALADEALEFLLETTDGELFLNCKAAKDKLNQEKGRDIKSGRNIGVQARTASEKGLGSPTQMRDLYRDITGNPRDSNTLFSELSGRYAFKDLKKVTDFLLHSLGADMKSKGPSIEPGELTRLIAETRSLQAILGVYRFFRLRMRLVESQFAREGLEMPEQLTFENLAKEFMALISDRYPNGEKVKERAVRLGIQDWIQAKIIALSQFRDAIREVAMARIYRNLQHRDDLYLAILEALEDLEDELDQKQDEEEEQQENQKKRETDTIEEAE